MEERSVGTFGQVTKAFGHFLRLVTKDSKSAFVNL